MGRGEVGVPFDQLCLTMPKQRGNGARTLPIHGQSGCEGKPQGVPRNAFQVSLLDRWQEHPTIKVIAIQVAPRGFTRKHPSRTFPGRKFPQQRFSLFVQGDVLKIINIILIIPITFDIKCS